MVARVSPAEACVPPKPKDSSSASGFQFSYPIKGLHRRTYVAVLPLHILKMLTLTELETLGNYYVGPRLTIKDDPSENGEAERLNAVGTALLYSSNADDFEDEATVHSTYMKKYKKVADRIRPVPATMPEKFHTICCIPSEPLISMPKLPFHPPDLDLTAKFTQEHREKMEINTEGFLWPEEEKLCFHLIKLQEDGIAWEASERGSVRTTTSNW
jgi:hypothetical protein